MSTSVIGEEPSAFVMTQSTSSTSRTSVAALSSTSSGSSSITGAASTTISSSSKVALSTTESTMSKSEPGSTIIQFTTIPALFRRIARATEEIITVHGISSEDFTRFFKQRKEDRSFILSLYLAETKCLIITIPTTVHEALHRCLDDHLRDDVVSMGLGRDFYNLGSSTFMDKDANGNIISEGEGDSCRKPQSIRPNENQYPTLVIEACWSQTLPKAREKARWWFDKSKGEVKIVLLIKSAPRTNYIWIEKWKLALATSRQGATTTRAAGALIPQCVHVIEIARAAGIDDVHPNRFDPASYIVTDGPLQLEFIDIFLRQPVPPGERDLIIGNTALQEYAADLWKNSQVSGQIGVDLN